MIEKIKNFLKDVQTESKKVTYPSKKELIGSTWVVISMVILVSIFLGIVDMALSKAVKFFIN